MVACLGLNDAVKVAMIKWRVPNAVAKRPVDVTSQIANRGYDLYEKRDRVGRSSNSGLGVGRARDSEE
jgi:hypothetical protein